MVKRGPHNPNITWENHVQISFGGTLGTGSGEVWTCGFRWALVDPTVLPTPAQLTACLGTATTDLAAWFGGASEPNQSYISQDAHLTYVKINAIQTNGLQREGDTIQGVIGPLSGPQAVQVPWYQTYAITLRTSHHRGRAHAGRFFPPMVALQPEAGSPLAALDKINGMASNAATLITSLNNDLGAHAGMLGHIAIMSPGNTVKGTLPTHALVTGVVVDRVADVQHRRTDRVKRSESDLVVIP